METLELLHKPPKEALVDIVNHHNDTTILAERVVFSNIQSLNGELTEVTIKKVDPPPLSTYRYKGQTSFTFHRLDLAVFFEGVVLEVELSLPSDTLEVAQKLGERFGFVFDENDFVLESITQDNYQEWTLKADPNSLRWVGEVALEITPPLPFLEEGFDKTRLDGFVHRMVDAFLPARVHNRELDGFVMRHRSVRLDDAIHVYALNGFASRQQTRSLSGVLRHNELDGFATRTQHVSLSERLYKAELNGFTLRRLDKNLFVSLSETELDGFENTL